MDFYLVHRRLFILNLLSFIVLALLSFAVLTPDTKPIFDTWVASERLMILSDRMTSVMLSVTAILSPVVLTSATVCLFVLLAMYKKRAEGFLLLGAMTGALVSSSILKSLFAIARPLSDLSVYGLSFPSGHATAASVFFLTILFVSEKHVHDKIMRFLLAALAFGFVLLTGFSRLYLGVHWLSDVLAGFALGMFWITLSFIILYRIQYHYGTTHSKRS